METKFGDRVREGMLAAGLETHVQLGKGCEVSRQTAKKWLDLDEPNLSAAHLFKLSECLRVRMRWLMTGRGVMGWGLEGEVERAIAILDVLTPEKATAWLECGQRLAGRQ